MGFYDDRVLPRVINVVMNTKQTRRIRERVCADLAGDVLEIGFGTGHNLPFLPATVSRLLAVEPSGGGVRLAQQRIDASGVPVEVVGLSMTRLDNYYGEGEPKPYGAMYEGVATAASNQP